MDRITAIASIEYVREKCQILGEQESPHDFFGTICEALSMAIEALQEPQVGGWIPVSERLTMQEIIDHCEETIQQIEYMYKTLYDDDSYEHIVSNRYWEHRQVAEWLKELQCYKYLEAQGRLIILPEDEGKVQAMNEKILELTDIAEAALKEVDE